MTKNTASCIVVSMLLAAACASASGSGAAARQTVRLEVIPVVEIGPAPLQEALSSPEEGRTTAGGMEFGETPLAVYPEGYGAKITAASEQGTVVEISVEAGAGGGCPGAAVRLTLTDP